MKRFKIWINGVEHDTIEASSYEQACTKVLDWNDISVEEVIEDG